MEDICNFLDLFGVEIHPSKDTDLNDLMAREHTASLAVQSLALGKIDLDTFADILESCGLDMDEYLLNLEVATDARS